MPPDTVETDTADAKQVLVFYSSKTAPNILDTYEEALAYLDELGVAVELVDITEEKERAQENGVLTTPTVVVDTGEETENHIGIVDGLQQVLEGDLYGQSLLHSMGFKEGRIFARDHDLADADEAAVADALDDHLRQHGVKGFELITYDTERPAAKGCITPDPDSDSGSNIHDRMEEFLGGVFTEIFDTGVMGAEARCGRDDNDCCVFMVEKQE